jgi:predicted ATPase with chaperone activity
MITVPASSPAPSDLVGALGFPRAPETLNETGLSVGFVGDLILKALYSHGARTGHQIADTICLPFSILDELLHDLQQRRFVEVRGTAGHGRAGYLFDLVQLGRERAQEALAASQYVGPAPVPLEQYSRWLLAHSIQGVHVTRTSIAEGFREMVLDRHMLELLGPAVNSAKSLFIYGDSGNGKTLIADTIANLLGGSMYVPYAVKVDGQIMLVYDPVYHRPPSDNAKTEVGEISIWRDSIRNWRHCTK